MQGARRRRNRGAASAASASTSSFAPRIDPTHVRDTHKHTTNATHDQAAAHHTIPTCSHAYQPTHTLCFCRTWAPVFPLASALPPRKPFLESPTQPPRGQPPWPDPGLGDAAQRRRHCLRRTRAAQDSLALGPGRRQEGVCGGKESHFRRPAPPFPDAIHNPRPRPRRGVHLRLSPRFDLLRPISGPRVRGQRLGSLSTSPPAPPLAARPQPQAARRDPPTRPLFSFEGPAT
jgi:hypothetical protein